MKEIQQFMQDMYELIRMERQNNLFRIREETILTPTKTNTDSAVLGTPSLNSGPFSVQFIKNKSYLTNFIAFCNVISNQQMKGRQGILYLCLLVKHLRQALSQNVSGKSILYQPLPIQMGLNASMQTEKRLMISVNARSLGMDVAPLRLFKN